jgi:DeoR/GlpR family transcriptional regulator of sugar metabolism
MTDHSDALVAVADGSKLGGVAPAVVVPVDSISTLVTDESADPAEAEAVRSRGVNVIVAPRAPERRARAAVGGGNPEGGT